jgi:hypothetical protein
MEGRAGSASVNKKLRDPLFGKDASQVTAVGGASAVPAGGPSLALGRLGHRPAGTMTGVRSASLDWDRRGAGNTRGEA